MKKIFVVLLAVCLGLGLSGFAEAESTIPLAAAEMTELTGQMKTQALDSQPLNDPAGEEARFENGILHTYDFAALYCNAAEMTADTEVQALSIMNGENPVIRNTGIDTSLDEVLSQYPNNNPELEGTPQKALLYLEDKSDGAFDFGYVSRDGQRIGELVYGCAEKAGDGYRIITMTYHLQSGYVSEIEITGLGNGEISDAGIRDELYAELSGLRNAHEYRRVKTSAVGTDLTPFGPEDLVIGGVNLDKALPEDYPGTPEVIGPEDFGDGLWIIRVSGEGYEAVYSCSEDGTSPKLMTYTILSDDLEGPRGVRLGDALYEDLNRFRHGENETDGATELLYGTAGTAPYGFADYAGENGMCLTYAALLSDGRTITLILQYENAVLKEIVLSADN